MFLSRLFVQPGTANQELPQQGQTRCRDNRPELQTATMSDSEKNYGAGAKQRVDAVLIRFISQKPITTRNMFFFFYRIGSHCFYMFLSFSNCSVSICFSFQRSNVPIIFPVQRPSKLDPSPGQS